MSYLFALVVYTSAIILLAVETAGKHPRRTIAQPILARNSWTLNKTYTPNDLLNWIYYSGHDPTNGLVNYLTQAEATEKGLALVTGNTFTMRVDNSTQLQLNMNRNSVRISSPDTYDNGLFITFLTYMPEPACGIWPAYWTVGPDWPNGGELDLIEGVNLGNTNQITVHSSSGCTRVPMSQGTSGVGMGDQCASSGGNNAGCAYSDPNTGNYGAEFNAAGGGVYAHLWDSTGFQVWAFQKTKLPQDLQQLQQDPTHIPDTTKWGEPVASYAFSDSCSASHFYNHAITFDITLCGDWAGGAYSSTCGNGKGPASCAEAITDPTNFDNSRWEISKIMVFQGQ